MPAAFKVPDVEDNDDGWGPLSVPEQLEGVPYAPYGKGEKVSKISDFTQSGFNKYGGKYYGSLILEGFEVLIASSANLCLLCDAD